ncbi:MAG TPA: hypothetical protein VJY62_07385 [Bacteroidia bacterium]|nr:hypothetical protein [Bacteroidia bacterium]
MLSHNICNLKSGRFARLSRFFLSSLLDLIKKKSCSSPPQDFLNLETSNYSYKLIADRLDLETETVRGYRKKVLGKIKKSGYSSNLEYAVSMGYIILERFIKKKKS